MQSFRTIGFAIIALGVLIIPFSIIHELGHSLVCYLDGNQFEIDIQFFTPSAMICLGNVSNPDVFRATGGGIAATIAGISGVLVAPKSLKIALFSITIVHLVNLVVETLLYQSYMNDAIWHIIFGLIDVIVFVTITFRMISYHTVTKGL